MTPAATLINAAERLTRMNRFTPDCEATFVIEMDRRRYRVRVTEEK